MRTIRVLVVGGGIGGFVRRVALRFAGAKVRVYEQASELGEVGAGDHTARVQQGSRANGMRMDAGQAITIGQPGVHDYDVEAEARAMAPRATR